MNDEPQTKKQWGDQLDSAERQRSNYRSRYQGGEKADGRISFAAHCYFRLSIRPVNEEIWKLEDDKGFRPDVLAVTKLYAANLAAWAKEERLLSAGSNFRTEREMIDAEVATLRAGRLYELAYDRWAANVAKQCGERKRYGFAKPPRKRRTVLVDGVRTKIAGHAS